MTDRAPPLSPRQLEVAQLVAQGFNTKRIAGALLPPISERRVQQLVGIIARKVGCEAGNDDMVMIARWWWAKAS